MGERSIRAAARIIVVQPSHSALPRSDTRVFVSYAHRDVDFVNRLYTALVAQDISVFLDDREIKIGDSIPDQIYRGIAESTHLLYVLSSHSIASQWVREELSIAKMREKEGKGFTILPLRIDDTAIPTGILHVKYGDFRAWRDEELFRTSFHALLEALGQTVVRLERPMIRWYAASGLLIPQLHRRLGYLAARLG